MIFDSITPLNLENKIDRGGDKCTKAIKDPTNSVRAWCFCKETHVSCQENELLVFKRDQMIPKVQFHLPSRCELWG